MAKQHELETADAEELCRQLLIMTNELDGDQEAAVHFMTWKRREQIMKIMEERYGSHADLRRINFGVFH